LLRLTKGATLDYTRSSNYGDADYHRLRNSFARQNVSVYSHTLIRTRSHRVVPCQTSLLSAYEKRAVLANAFPSPSFPPPPFFSLSRFFFFPFFFSRRDRRYARADSIKLPFASASADGRALSFRETSLASTSTAFDEARNS